MTALELLTELRSRGIEVKVSDDGDKVMFRPKSAVDDGLVAAIRQHKPALIILLAHPVDWQLGDPINWDAEPEPIDCEKCQRFDCWWDATGRRRCLTCDPPTASRRWLAICEKIRAKRRKGQR